MPEEVIKRVTGIKYPILALSQKELKMINVNKGDLVEVFKNGNKIYIKKANVRGSIKKVTGSGDYPILFIVKELKDLGIKQGDNVKIKFKDGMLEVAKHER